MWPIFKKPTDGDGSRRLPSLLTVGSPLTVARAAHGWLRRGMAALAVPLPQGAPADVGELPMPRQPAPAYPAAFSSDSPSVGRARLAVLIDADNAQASLVGQVLAEVATFGTAHVKRAYGDWTSTSLKSWKEQLLAHSIQPIQQFAYVAGKNATDAAMVIDAMDLLYRGRLDGFCLVSSDSDFTRLAARLRESGRIVYGFGERKTPRSFVAACDKFVYVENLADPRAAPAPADLPLARPAGASPAEPVAADGAKPAPRQPVPGARLRGDTNLVNGLRDAVEEASDDDGWASQAYVGSIISRRSSDFDPRDYGYRKLGELIAAIDLFEVERRSAGTGKPAVVYLRDKRPRRAH
nr:NYN domain-containing protein [Frankia sp. Cr2]